MGYTNRYEAIEPSRSDVDRKTGPVLLEFGARTCGLCRYAEPVIERALAEHPEVKHLKIEDGSGRPLGRSFGVRLWPTLVFLRDGHEVSRLIRPANATQIGAALRQIDPVDADSL